MSPVLVIINVFYTDMSPTGWLNFCPSLVSGFPKIPFLPRVTAQQKEEISCIL